jgi:hypothetical protein
MHSSIARRLTAFSCPLTLIATVHCNPPSSANAEFRVHVDSIRAPASIAPAETLSITFFGFIGSNLCSRLARIDKGVGPSVLAITFYGERSDSQDCQQMPALLEHTEHLPPPLEDPFIIRVQQPTGPPLEKVVRVQ